MESQTFDIKIGRSFGPPYPLPTQRGSLKSAPDCDPPLAQREGAYEENRQNPTVSSAKWCVLCSLLSAGIGLPHLPAIIDVRCCSLGHLESTSVRSIRFDSSTAVADGE